jgi:hypothetical protein
VRLLRTVAGDHVLVRAPAGRQHLDAAGRPLTLPGEPALRALLDDAIRDERARYGEIASLERDEAGASASARTTSGVTIDLDWTTLALSQSGRDTRRIDALYRIHYLQWTGVAALDRVLGVAGLASLVALAALGLRLAFARTS